jgi:hypothetical protein
MQRFNYAGRCFGLRDIAEPHFTCWHCISAHDGHFKITAYAPSAARMVPGASGSRGHRLPPLAAEMRFTPRHFGNRLDTIGAFPGRAISSLRYWRRSFDE